MKTRRNSLFKCAGNFKVMDLEDIKKSLKQWENNFFQLNNKKPTKVCFKLLIIFVYIHFMNNIAGGYK